jgi:hypothetical protein
MTMAKHRTNLIDRALGIAWPLAVAAFAAVLCLEAASMVAVAPDVMRGVEGGTDTLFVIIPYPTAVAEVGGPGPAMLFIFFMSAILFSIVWLLRDYEALGRSFHRALRDRTDVPDDSQAGLSLQLLAVMLLASVAWYMMLAMFGVETSTPAFDEMESWELGYAFAKASVYEELITRVLYVGVPMAAIALARKRAGWWKLLAGAKGDLDATDWVLIGASGLVFGLAHAPGWDLWKVAPTFVSGLGFGYLFAKKGLAAAIVVHFAVDYLSMPYEVWGLDGMNVVLNLFLFGLLALGVYYAVRFAMEAHEKVSPTKASEPYLYAQYPQMPPSQAPPFAPLDPSRATAYPPPPAQHASAPQAPSAPAHQPPPGSPPGWSLQSRFVCTRCRNVEASYVDGALVCTKCKQEYKFL